MLAPIDMDSPDGPAAELSWPRVAGAALAFWAVFVPICITYQMATMRIAYNPKMLPFDGLLIVLGAGVSVGMAAAIRRLTGFGLWGQVGLAALLAAALAYPFELTFRGLLAALQVIPPLHEIGYGKLLVGSLFWLAPFSIVAAGSLALAHHADARRRERLMVAIQFQAQQAQVRALRYQINPHFLYNTLNAVAALVLDRRNDEAETMVLQLASFFRASLSIDPIEDVTLGDEIAHQALYLDIERVRFPNRLDVAIDLPPALEKAGVPSFILQPLVENALKHGMRGAGRRLWLRIAAWSQGEVLTIEIADNGPGKSSVQGTGTGLRNVERRLRSRHPGQARLQIDSGDTGFTVRLHLPLVLLA